MSLNWQWTDKMGEVIYEDDQYHPEHPYTTDIYEGNALMIWVNHLPDEMYNVGNFCVDMEHFKNMLGLNAKKGYGTTNYFNSYNIKRYGINGCTLLGDGSISIILDVANLYASTQEL